MFIFIFMRSMKFNDFFIGWDIKQIFLKSSEMKIKVIWYLRNDCREIYFIFGWCVVYFEYQYYYIQMLWKLSI